MTRPVPNPEPDWLAQRRRLETILRLQAAAVVGDPSMQSQESIRLLIEGLRDPSDDVRELATAALGEFGPRAYLAVPTLIAAVETDPNAVVRRRAARALGDIGQAALPAVPALAAAVDDPDPGVRQQAIATLGEFGPQAADAVPALVAALQSDDVRRRAVAGAALTRIGPVAAPALVGCLGHPSPTVRAKVATILGRFDDASVRPALERLLADPDDEVRRAAYATLMGGS